MPPRWALEQAEDAIGLGDLDAALAILDRHLAQHPDDEEARRLRADVEAARHDAPAGFGDLRPDARHLAEPAPPAPPEPPRPLPPVGVMVLAALHAASGAVLALLGFAALFASPGLGMLVLLAGAAILGLAAGLWRLRKWAWLASVLLSGLGVAFNLFGLGAGGVRALGGLVVQAVVLAYLLKVGRRFGAPSRRSATGAGAGL